MWSITPALKTRFFSHVTKTETCWVLTGATQGTMKYGCFGILNKNYQAHRISWILHRGSIPKWSDVLHKCDVPRCVNPAHLFLGDDSINIKDAIAKGRVVVPIKQAALHHKGEQNGFHKLTEADVMRIKVKLLEGMTGYKLSKEYGVDSSTIADIRHERTWKHLCATPRPAGG